MAGPFDHPLECLRCLAESQRPFSKTAFKSVISRPMSVSAGFSKSCGPQQYGHSWLHSEVTWKSMVATLADMLVGRANAAAT